MLTQKAGWQIFGALDRAIRGSALIATQWPPRRGLCADAGFHHLRVVPVFQRVQRPLRKPSAFNRQFFSNGKLWAVLGMVVGLQALAFAVASAILLLDEGRKLILNLLQCSQRKPI